MKTISQLSMALAGFAIAASAAQGQGAPTLEHKATLALTLAGQGDYSEKVSGEAPKTVTVNYKAAIETSKLSNKELLLLIDDNIPGGLPGGISGWSISIFSEDGELQAAFLTKKGALPIQIDQYLDINTEGDLHGYKGKTVTKFDPASETTTESYSFKGLASIASSELDGYNFGTQGLYIGNGTYNGDFDTLGAFSFSSILGILKGGGDSLEEPFDNSDLSEGGDSIIEGWIKATSGKVFTPPSAS
ncbi:MAG: hypothetical protein ABI600_15985 [Luteolibacter sp.]